MPQPEEPQPDAVPSNPVEQPGLVGQAAVSFDQPQASERGSIQTNATGVVEQSAFAIDEADSPVDSQFQQLVLNPSLDGENIIGNEESQEVKPKPKSQPGAHMRTRHYYKSGSKANRSTNYFAKEGVKASRESGMVNEDMREDEE